MTCLSLAQHCLPGPGGHEPQLQVVVMTLLLSDSPPQVYAHTSASGSLQLPFIAGPQAHLPSPGAVRPRLLLTSAQILLPHSASQTPCPRPCLGFWIYSQVCPRSINGVLDFTPGPCVWIHGLEERKLPVALAPLSGHVGSSCFQWPHKDLGGVGGLPSWGELQACSGALVSPQV